jgi:hypothetical protein
MALKEPDMSIRRTYTVQYVLKNGPTEYPRRVNLTARNMDQAREIVTQRHLSALKGEDTTEIKILKINRV